MTAAPALDDLLGLDAVLDADERGKLLTDADDELRSRLGEAADDRDRLVSLGRAVCRRDSALAARLGLPGLAATYDLSLPAGIGPLAIAVDEGVRLEGGVLNGPTHVLGRGRHAVIAVRSDTGTRRAVVDLGTAPAVGTRELAGLRGTPLTTYLFRKTSLPETAVHPPAHSLLPAMAVGALDTQLRLALRFARERHLYGRPVADIPHARNLLVTVFRDLQLCDRLSRLSGTDTRVKRIVREAGHRLTVLLGARSYLREGPYGTFQKQLRDLPTLLDLGTFPEPPAPDRAPEHHPVDDDTREALFTELLARDDAALSFDLARTPLLLRA
ncbi:hypothetical protein ACFZCY_43645 [Streptomyces sp. NPDC007983]|uniref:hypothetical protein n=1 Tax=Streptomyces sp. NPDC007983 TaxID=3364800 RepID=UPI0036E34F17